MARKNACPVEKKPEQYGARSMERFPRFRRDGSAAAEKARFSAGWWPSAGMRRWHGRC